MQPPGLDDAPQVVERPHFEFVVEQLDALRPQAGQRGHIAELAGQLLLQRIEQFEMPGLDDVGDLAG